MTDKPTLAGELAALVEVSVPLKYYEWLATIEPDVRVNDLTPFEIAGLVKALAANDEAAREKAEVAWLVEFPAGGERYEGGQYCGPATPIKWLCAIPRGDRIIGRTTDASEAIRFARKVDADAMILRLDDNRFGPTNAYACEHMWMQPQPSPSASPRYPRKD